MTRIVILMCLATLLLAGVAAAQEGEHGHDGPLFFDPASAPIIQPELDDFLDDTAVDDGTGAAEDASPLGVGAYTEVTGDYSVISIAPRWTFNDTYRVKVRLPWVLERKLQFWDGEYSASGLGDISVDFSYRRRYDQKRQRLEFVASVKLPTGDDEKEVDGHYVPLGTGSVDGMVKATYVRNVSDTGLLASLMYRLNSANETISEWVGSDPQNANINTTRTTNANQLVGGVFGRRQVADKIWVHLGATLMLTSSGKQELESEGPDVVDSTSESDLEQGSILMDLYPGVSYDLGMVTPYLGARIPVVTSYDNDLLDDSRDTAVVFQVSYNPGRLVGN